MGLFSKIFGGAKQLCKVGNGVANVTNLLDQYENDPDITFIYTSAWVTRIAVLDVVESNNYPMTYVLYAPIKGHQTKITLQEAYMMTVGRIYSKANSISQSVYDNVKSILDKEEGFYEIDKQMTPEIKKIFL